MQIAGCIFFYLDFSSIFITISVSPFGSDLSNFLSPI